MSRRNRVMEMAIDGATGAAAVRMDIWADGGGDVRYGG